MAVAPAASSPGVASPATLLAQHDAGSDAPPGEQAGDAKQHEQLQLQQRRPKQEALPDALLPEGQADADEQPAAPQQHDQQRRHPHRATKANHREPLPARALAAWRAWGLRDSPHFRRAVQCSVGTLLLMLIFSPPAVWQALTVSPASANPQIIFVSVWGPEGCCAGMQGAPAARVTSAAVHTCIAPTLRCLPPTLPRVPPRPPPRRVPGHLLHGFIGVPVDRRRARARGGTRVGRVAGRRRGRAGRWGAGCWQPGARAVSRGGSTATARTAAARLAAARNVRHGLTCIAPSCWYLQPASLACAPPPPPSPDMRPPPLSAFSLFAQLCIWLMQSMAAATTTPGPRR